MIAGRIIARLVPGKAWPSSDLGSLDTLAQTHAVAASAQTDLAWPGGMCENRAQRRTAPSERAKPEAAARAK